MIVLHYPNALIVPWRIRISIYRIIEKSNPLFIGFSVNTGPSTSLSAEFSETIKNDIGDIPIVWGGVHPTMVPHQCLSENYIDFVVLGEGEETIVELSHALEGQKELSSIRGIGYKQNGHPIINPPRPKIKNIDKYRPAWHLIDIRKYLNEYREYGQNLSRMISYLTSRGCPYRCAFCYNLAWENRRMRYHSIKRVLSDIKWLKEEYDVDAVIFQDDNFFVNPKRTFEIIEEIDLPWYGEPRVNYITEEFAKKVKETNCINLLVGAESGSDRILQYIKKDITVAQIEKATKIMAKYQIPLAYTWIIGFPGETWEEIMQTLHFIEKLQKYYMDNPEIFHNKVGIYLPYPGTPLYNISLKSGFQQPTNKNWGKLKRYEMNFDFPWLNREKTSGLIKYLKYAGKARYNPRLDLKVIRKLYKYRLKKENFSCAFEIKLYSYLVDKISISLKSFKKL